jgi:CRISPR/Cas system Type II protein with McrA/HNH and RuvC-like nuclease domain
MHYVEVCKEWWSVEALLWYKMMRCRVKKDENEFVARDQYEPRRVTKFWNEILVKQELSRTQTQLTLRSSRVATVTTMNVSVLRTCLVQPGGSQALT